VGSLLKRPRPRRLIERAARHALDYATASPQTIDVPVEPEPDPPPASEVPDRSFESFARELLPGPLAAEHSTVSRLLFERLSEQDVAAVEQRLAEVPELQAHYETAPNPTLRGALILAYGMWLGVPEVAAKTGLLAARPPEDVHAMARGPLAAAGGLYEADIVADALASVGVDIAQTGSALDIGCSSGRVVRALGAAYPQTSWHACDPNEQAIAWASENVPGIDFFVNGNAPPLPLASASLDLVYAISIWSHFAPELGLRWFEEMHRVVHAGGHLICTTHGLTSVGYYAIHQHRTVEQSQEIADALYRRGWWYAQEFGDEGDWGVINPDWGTAFLSPEWMLAQLCPQWRVLEFAPGRNQENQDVYVLERV
jgi:SAM-dependent methyltransferase